MSEARFEEYRRDRRAALALGGAGAVALVLWAVAAVPTPKLPVRALVPVTARVLLNVATAPASVPPIVIASTQRFAQRTPVLPRSSVESVSLMMSEPEVMPALVVSRPPKVCAPVTVRVPVIVVLPVKTMVSVPASVNNAIWVPPTVICSTSLLDSEINVWSVPSSK